MHDFKVTQLQSLCWLTDGKKKKKKKKLGYFGAGPNSFIASH
jgi:hypothetical protein